MNFRTYDFVAGTLLIWLCSFLTKSCQVGIYYSPYGCIIVISYVNCQNFEPDLGFIHAELPDRSNAAAALFLPLTKDNKTKEENHKLMNGNTGDSADWVLLRFRFFFLSQYLWIGFLLRVAAVILKLLIFSFSEAKNSNQWQDHGRRKRCAC